ncbi:MAG: FMN-binding protein, partial [Acidobacteria bacterium]|nr:FMN-binding protein [Acidobacteriota bacterium]
IAPVVLVAVTGLALAGCFVGCNPANVQQARYTGEVEGSSMQGHGGQVTVKLTLVNGIITAVDVAHFESPGFGHDLIDQAKPLIIQANSFDPVDGLTGATVTKNALMEAGKQALDKINGAEQP